MEQKFTYTEVTQLMSLDEVMDYNDILDAWNEAANPPIK